MTPLRWLKSGQLELSSEDMMSREMMARAIPVCCSLRFLLMRSTKRP